MEKLEADKTTEYMNNRYNKVWDKLWYFKIPDLWRQNPFDVIWVINKKAFAYEFKIIRVKDTSYESVYSLLEMHQVGNLYTFKLAWWISKIIWRSIHTKKYHEYDFKLL